MNVQITPESPDNKSIREQLAELKKLNSSTASYGKLTIRIGIATLIVSIVGFLIVLLK